MGRNSIFLFVPLFRPTLPEGRERKGGGGGMPDGLPKRKVAINFVSILSKQEIKTYRYLLLSFFFSGGIIIIIYGERNFA